MKDVPKKDVVTRLALLRELATSLAQAQCELLASNLEGFDRQSERQQQLLGEWKLQLAAPRSPDQTHEEEAAGGEPSCWVQMRRLGDQQELSQAHLHLRQQVRAHAALLRRVRRTLEIFCRVLANSGLTYTPPAPAGRPSCLRKGSAHVQP